jgi:two-component system NtrC family response regulator
LQQENRRLQESHHPTALGGLITRDAGMQRSAGPSKRWRPAMQRCCCWVKVAPARRCWRAACTNHPRSKGRFVAINCAAIPDNLLESELFGYEKGAFTGAAKTTPGKIETAHGGTLMLDEIGDLPMPLQAKLLRFLQERVVERLGGRQEIPVDVRIVCATHQDLKAQIGDGRFREDLYYRLAEIVVQIPPLRSAR